MSTHEELLARIDRIDESLSQRARVEDLVTNKALREVIELHKPEYISANEYSATYCSHCGNMEAPACYWPCPTIQAIDVELS